MAVLRSRPGAQSTCSVVGGGVGQASWSQCITGLHPSRPHLHIWVEALLATLLPVALGVKGQLGGVCLHLARCQEPQGSGPSGWVFVTGERRGHCRAVQAWISWVHVPSGLSRTWVSRAWMSLQQGSVQGQGYIASLSLGNHREEKVTVLRESQRRKGREPACPLTQRLFRFFLRVSVLIYKLKKLFFTSHNVL